MGNTILRNATDSWTTSNRPTLNRSTTARLGLDSTGDIRRAFLLFTRPFPLGVTILHATLRVRNAGAWTGTPTLTVQRISSKYSMSRINHNNQPGVTGTTATASIAAAPDGSVWEFDVTSMMQSVSNGGAWYGFRITTNSGNQFWLYSANGPADMRPELEIAWGDEPDAPTELAPTAGRAVSTNRPILSFDFTDVSGDTDMQACQLQFSSVASPYSAFWDTGTLFTNVPEVDTSVLLGNSISNGGAETDVTGASASTGSTVTRTTTNPYTGVGAFLLTKDATAANASLSFPNAPAVPGQSYVARARFRAVTTGRQVNTYIDFRAADGITTISTAQGTAVTDNTTGYVTVNVMGVAPAGTASYRVRCFITSQGANEAHQIDDVYAQQGLGTTAAFNPYGGLTQSTPVWWRVRVQDAAGLWSDWSEPAQIVWEPLPTITVTNPSSGTPSVTDVTPPVTWTVTGGGSQVTYQVLVYDTSDLSTSIHESSKYTSGDLTYTIPEGVIISQTATYRVVVRVWDSINREKNGLLQPYAEGTRDFTYVSTGGTTGITSLVATQQTPYPWVDLTWVRSVGIPDRYNIYRDSALIDVVDGPTVFVSGTSYKYTDKLASPRVQHIYQVIAVTNGLSANTGIPTASVTTRLTCPVLMNLDGSDPMYFMKPDVQPQAMTLQERLDPVGAPPVLFTQYLGGFEGSIEGLFIDEVPGTITAREMRDRFKKAKKRVGQTMLFYNIDEVLKIVPHNMTYKPEAYSGSNVRYRARFDFFEVD